jgi:hypothetical protein
MSRFTLYRLCRHRVVRVWTPETNTVSTPCAHTKTKTFYQRPETINRSQALEPRRLRECSKGLMKLKVATSVPSREALNAL